MSENGINWLLTLASLFVSSNVTSKPEAILFAKRGSGSLTGAFFYSDRSFQDEYFFLNSWIHAKLTLTIKFYQE